MATEQYVCSDERFEHTPHGMKYHRHQRYWNRQWNAGADHSSWNSGRRVLYHIRHTVKETH